MKGFIVYARRKPISFELGTHLNYAEDLNGGIYLWDFDESFNKGNKRFYDAMQIERDGAYEVELTSPNKVKLLSNKRLQGTPEFGKHYDNEVPNRETK